MTQSLNSSPRRRRFQLLRDRFGDLPGGAGSFLFVAPLPLGGVAVAVGEAALGGDGVDVLGELFRELERDLVAGVVLGADLRGNFLPVEDFEGRDLAVLRCAVAVGVSGGTRRRERHGGRR